MVIFCSSTPLKNPRIKILKNEKICRRYHYFTHVYQKSQYMMHGSWNTKWDKQNFLSFDIWFLKYKVRQTEILGHFLPFQPLDSLENQNFSIEKNIWRYYHFTHLHHKWQSYDVMVPEIRSVTDLIFCHFGLFFALLPRLTTQKIKILKKWKKHLEMLSLYTCVPPMTIKWCMVPQIWRVTDRIFCHFGPFLPFYPLTTQKFKILKNCTQYLEKSSFYTSVPKIMIIWYTVP